MPNNRKGKPKEPPKEVMRGIKITFKVPSNADKSRIDELSKGIDALFAQFEDIVKEVKASRHDDTVEEIEAGIIDIWLRLGDNECPACKLTFLDDQYNFCPHCGQDLNLEVEPYQDEEEEHD